MTVKFFILNTLGHQKSDFKQILSENNENIEGIHVLADSLLSIKLRYEANENILRV